MTNDRPRTSPDPVTSELDEADLLQELAAGRRIYQDTFDRAWQTYPAGETLPSYRLMDLTCQHLGLSITTNPGNAPAFALAPGARTTLVQPRRSQHELVHHLAATAARANLRVRALYEPWDVTDGQTISLHELSALKTPASALAAVVAADILRPIDASAAPRPDTPREYAADHRERRVAAYRLATFTFLWGLGVLSGHVLTRSVHDRDRRYRSVTLGDSQRITLDGSGVHLRTGPRQEQQFTVTFPVDPLVFPSAQAYEERLNQRDPDDR
ncbi:hypothetical protein [Deinococcus soli (ex Cha et al. 2016)]|uniref:Uncharacterized protein n=2 Tax=Deinococcus soli (ex Cha et al. 2016) TaxID=1309411 RepID=A0ACC6KHH7_9DEIO|nr:hypothetical protein [Deinococcus soli (ex Cha et al. 2016)]MDR6218817.1 hypothetical protein [Deinococcus soli (ex Cha et al. 2016)]MDR6328614.1 hypothetical protein [Deinococcus soli (ex Cha et al. 2016)]MDR6751899.1 hypothetical protein [Deinococcus soli (ex Cha et al. 2016)]